MTILGQFPNASQFSESESISWGEDQFLMSKDSVGDICDNTEMHPAKYRSSVSMVSTCQKSHAFGLMVRTMHCFARGVCAEGGGLHCLWSKPTLSGACRAKPAEPLNDLDMGQSSPSLHPACQLLAWWPTAFLSCDHGYLLYGLTH